MVNARMGSTPAIPRARRARIKADPLLLRIGVAVIVVRDGRVLLGQRLGAQRLAAGHRRRRDVPPDARAEQRAVGHGRVRYKMARARKGQWGSGTLCLVVFLFMLY